MATEQGAFGFVHLWAQGDAVTHGIAAMLALMSIGSWYVIAAKARRLFRMRRAGNVAAAFWSASSLKEALDVLSCRAPGSPLHALAQQGIDAIGHYDDRDHASLSGALDRSEFLTRTLCQSISHSTARLESGLTALASIGSTAPFVGLFATVWGIYRALASISVSGAATLDKVAGPVGEALIMTAAGLAVAIPAVLAYNAFTRANRLELAELDAFAHHLHAYLTTGARLTPGAGAKLMRAHGKPLTAYTQPTGVA